VAASARSWQQAAQGWRRSACQVPQRPRRRVVGGGNRRVGHEREQRGAVVEDPLAADMLGRTRLVRIGLDLGAGFCRVAALRLAAPAAPAPGSPPASAGPAALAPSAPGATWSPPARVAWSAAPGLPTRAPAAPTRRRAASTARRSPRRPRVMPARGNCSDSGGKLAASLRSVRVRTVRRCRLR
jgi:hypothetical protein